MHAAVDRLIGRGDGSSLSVADIVREASIGRSTFYAHYRTLDDLAAEIVASALLRISDEGEVARARAAGPSLSLTRATQRALVEHAQRYRALYVAAFELATSQQPYADTVAAVAAIAARSMEQSVEVPAGVRIDLAAAYLASATVGLLAAWLTGRLDATEDEIIDQLVALMPSWLAGTD